MLTVLSIFQRRRRHRRRRRVAPAEIFFRYIQILKMGYFSLSFINTNSGIVFLLFLKAKSEKTLHKMIIYGKKNFPRRRRRNDAGHK